MRFFFLIAAIAIGLCGDWQLRGQTPSGVSATIQFSDDQTITVTDFSNQIGVQPGQGVGITIRFSAYNAGEPVVVEALDGGVTSIGSNLPVLNDDGSVSFTFVASANPGRNAVSIRLGSASVCLQLWVIDSANPQNNPSTLTAVSNG